MSKPRPRSVFWFANGMAAVCDQQGQQMPEFQGRHEETLKAFKAAGIDWKTLPEIQGCPRRQ